MKRTIGEIFKDGILEYAEREKLNPYEVTINSTDMYLIDEIADKGGLIKHGEHPRDRHKRMIAGLRRSPLWKHYGYINFPGFRGLNHVALWRLKEA